MKAESNYFSGNNIYASSFLQLDLDFDRGIDRNGD